MRDSSQDDPRILLGSLNGQNDSARPVLGTFLAPLLSFIPLKISVANDQTRLRFWQCHYGLNSSSNSAVSGAGVADISASLMSSGSSQV